MNLFELRDAVQSYVQSDESSFLASVDVFIRMAERDLYRIIEFPPEEKTQQFSLSSGGYELDLPEDYAACVGIFAIPPAPPHLPETLDVRSVDYLRGVYGLPATMASGRPRDAAITETKVLIAPKADAAYTVALVYQAYPESVTALESGESWLSKYGEEALLYTAICHALVFLKAEKESLEIAEARRTQAVEKLIVFAKDWFNRG
jgi:hypothetical protein